MLTSLIQEEASEFEEKRRESARKIASNTANFKAVQEGTKVRSDSNPKRWYFVAVSEDESFCECADYYQNGAKCKHIYAVELYVHGKFLPKPEPALSFERLGNRIVLLLEQYAREHIDTEEFKQLISQIRAFQRKNHDLLHLVLYIERGMINRSYVRDVLADFATGAASLREIQKKFSLY